MQIKQYSGTMLRSRAVSGKYEAFLSESDLVSTDALENADYIILDSAGNEVSGRMRKINTILSVLLLVIFMLHGLMGSFMLLGIGSSAGKILAWVGVAVLAAHTVIGVILTINTLKISKNAGNSYLKQNAVFWARRASGLAILILMFFHIGLFGGVQDGIYILFPFTTVKLITQLLLVAALFIHLFINIRPLLVSLGIISYKERRGDIYLILSVLLLFSAGAVIIYYIGWQTL